MIKADDAVSSVNDWQKKTTQFYSYVGAGNHLDMLVHPFLEKNVVVIRCIILQFSFIGKRTCAIYLQ